MPRTLEFGAPHCGSGQVIIGIAEPLGSRVTKKVAADVIFRYLLSQSSCRLLRFVGVFP
jgi:hypothetical protein